MTAAPTLSPAPAFYVAGGTMPPDAPCYVERAADRELLAALRRGEFCYVLTSRQMGKSSLMVRTATRLREASIAVAVLDVTAIGQNLTVEQWYQGLLGRVGRQLGLEEALEAFWLQHPRLAPLQRFMGALEQVVLPEIGRAWPDERLPEPPSLVVFIDEIDFVRSLPFPTDELFAAIRECYNRRAAEPELRRLAFCLLGVASPADLIQDPRSTPFNIGRRIELTDFTPAEALPLAAGLLAGPRPLVSAQEAAHLLARVLSWTGGQPYLTQRLCGAVSEELRSAPPVRRNGAVVVDTVCKRLFLAPGSERRDDNLLFVRERVLRGDADPAAVLELYQRVCAGRRVPVDEANTAQETLRLAGLVAATGRAAFLTPRNRIYQQVFDRRWVRENMPDAELRRQRVAYRRGLFRAATVGTAVVLAMTALAAAAIRNERRANRMADRYRSALSLKEEARRKLETALHDVERERSTAHREAQRAQWAESQERRQRTAAERERSRAELQTLLAKANGAEAQQERDESRRRLVRLLVQNGTRAQEEGDLSVALLWLVEALKRDAGTPSRAEIHQLRIADLLRFCPRVTRVWQQPGGLTCVAMSADGNRVAAAYAEGVARIWDARTGKSVGSPLKHQGAIASLAFSPDGRRLLTGSRDRTARLWDARTALPLTPPLAHIGEVAHVVFSRDGSRVLASSTEGAQVWSTLTGELAGPAIRPEPGVMDAQLSPDGKLVVTGGVNRTARVWSTDTGQPRTPELRQGQSISQVCFSPDGRYVATASYDKTARVWDAVTGAAVTPALRHENAVLTVQFSADGRRLLTGSADSTARTWDARSGAPGAVLRHTESVTAARFSEDGTRVLTVSDDRTARVWDADTGEATTPVLHPGRAACGGALDRSNRWLVTASVDGAVRLWDLAAGPEGSLPEEPVTDGQTSRLGSNGASGFTLCDYGIGMLWSQPDGLQKRRLAGLGEDLVYCELSPDGKFLVVGGGTPPQVRSTRTGEILWTIAGPVGPTSCAAFSPDGSRLAFGGENGLVWLCQASDRKSVSLSLPHRGRISMLKFSPGGTRLATITTRLPKPRREGRLAVWDLLTGKKLLIDGRGRGDFNSVDFSPDGRRLVSAARGGSCVWDVESGRPITPAMHPSPVLQARFSPDGAKVITVGEDGTARIWSAVTGSVLAPPLRHPRQATDASFSPDGRLVLTKGPSDIQVWDAGTGEPVCAPIVLPLGCERARFTAPRRIVTENARGTILRWNLPTTPHPVATLDAMARLLTGQQLGDGLNPVTLPSRDLSRYADALRRSAPDAVISSPARETAWHLLELDRAERAQQWSSVVAHAGRLAQLQPHAWRHPARRGLAYAEMSNWASAAADLRQAVRLGADDRLIRYRLALTQLASGDQMGFGRTAEGMLLRYSVSPDPREPDLAAWTRALGAGPGASALQAITVLRRGRSGVAPDASWLGSLGALQLRSGQYAEAVATLEQVLSLRHGEGTVPDYLFLSLAYASLGQERSASAALAHAHSLAGRAREGGERLPWEDRAEQGVLLREAEHRVRLIR